MIPLIINTFTMVVCSNYHGYFFQCPFYCAHAKCVSIYRRGYKKSSEKIFRLNMQAELWDDHQDKKKGKNE